jgi:hypothetical protein
LQQVPDGKTPLLVNLDETYISFIQSTAAGNRADASKIPEHCGFSFRERIHSKFKRGGVSMVGLVCDDAELQRALPQFILSNEHTMSQEFERLARACAPSWMKLYRLQSPWMTHDMFREILRVLARAVKHVSENRLIILLCDCVRSHIHSTIAIEAERLGIWLVFIPAGLTWLLQPLDVAVFGRFKYWIQRLSVEMRIASGTDDLSLMTWWETVIRATQLCFYNANAAALTSFRRINRHHRRSASDHRVSQNRDHSDLTYGPWRHSSIRCFNAAIGNTFLRQSAQRPNHTCRRHFCKHGGIFPR